MVWTRTTRSGHGKCQCTVQLTVFADGEPRIKPLLIFQGDRKANPRQRTEGVRPTRCRKIPGECMVR